jgi:hypothetical protein
MPLAFVSPFHPTNGGPPHSHPYLSTLSPTRRALTFNRDVGGGGGGSGVLTRKIVYAAAVHGLFPNASTDV